jgi:DNA-binding transcriptional LysR family regulator
MDRLLAMQAFVKVVETGSFSATARQLHMGQPAVSKMVAQLEDKLGTRLFVRTTRSLTLTDNGASYLEACKRILEDVGDAERKVAGEYLTPRGELVITAPTLFGRLYIMPVVAEFLATFPDINVRLTLTDRNVHLVDEQIDLAVRIGDLIDSTMVAVRVGSVRRIVCASPKFLAANGTPKSPLELAEKPCVTFEELLGGAYWNFYYPGSNAEKSIPVRCRLSINTSDAAVDAAVAGVGFTQVLSYQAAKAVEAGQLRVVLRKFERSPIPVSIVHPGQARVPLKTRSFLEFAAPRLRRAIGA